MAIWAQSELVHERIPLIQLCTWLVWKESLTSIATPCIPENAWHTAHAIRTYYCPPKIGGRSVGSFPGKREPLLALDQAQKVWLEIILRCKIPLPRCSLLQERWMEVEIPRSYRLPKPIEAEVNARRTATEPILLIDLNGSQSALWAYYLGQRTKISLIERRRRYLGIVPPARVLKIESLEPYEKGVSCSWDAARLSPYVGDNKVI